GGARRPCERALRGSLLLARSAEAGEEGAETSRALLGQDPALHLEAVVQARVLSDREQGVDGAGLRIPSAIHDAGHARGDQSARAHRARLERRVHGGAFEPPVADARRGAAEREELGVRRRILAPLAAGVFSLVLLARPAPHYTAAPL